MFECLLCIPRITFVWPHPTYLFSVGMDFEVFHHVLCARCIKKCCSNSVVRVIHCSSDKPNRLRMGLCAELIAPALSAWIMRPVLSTSSQ
jgi:hypothetical protein